MIIINNFLPLEEQKSLLQYVLSSQMPYRIYETYHFEENSVMKDKVHSPNQFTHFLYMHGEEKASSHIGILRPIFDELQKRCGVITMFRAKINVTYPYPPFMSYQSQVPHTDMAYDDGRKVPHQVFLYYINDADGPTYFYNENNELVDAIEPKMGRAVIFDGSILHAGSNPVKFPLRFALNINFRKGKDQIP